MKQRGRGAPQAVSMLVELRVFVAVVAVVVAAAALIVDGDHRDAAALCNLHHPGTVGFLERTALGLAVVGAGVCRAYRPPQHRLQPMIAVAAASQVTKVLSLLKAAP